MNKKYDTVDDLLAKAAEGKSVPFKQIDKYNRLYLLKGGVGQMIEESLFEYKPNSDSAPDFENLGIELKVTPFVIDKKGKHRAKERLVLNIINYMEENLDSFYDSHFWYKNSEILMMFYEYHSNVPRSEWYIDDFLLYKWPENDLLIVIRDWQTITNKIKNGEAHLISESDTLYLAACTKGATAEKSYRDQPFSPVKAKQRAYSLKSSYMTYLLNHYVYGKKLDERIIKSNDILKSKTFEEVIIEMIKPYIGKTQKQLVQQLSIKESKQTNHSIINKILHINGDVSKTEEFQKANIHPKTIRIEKNGNIKESMSFATFKFKEIINQDWEDSDFYNYLSQTRFMFIVFQKIDDKDENSILKEVKFWGMPQKDIDEAEKCWNMTVDIIKKGIIFNPKGKSFSNNLPGRKDNPVAHVRPHASKSYYKFGDYEIGNQKDGNELPDGRWMTTQCFWLNSKYILKIISSK